MSWHIVLDETARFLLRLCGRTRRWTEKTYLHLHDHILYPLKTCTVCGDKYILRYRSPKCPHPIDPKGPITDSSYEKDLIRFSQQ